MKLQKTICLLVFAASCLADESLAARHSGATGEKLLRLEREWDEAMVKADAPSIGRIEADGFAYVYDGVPGNKEGDLEIARTHAFQGKIELIDPQVKLFGEEAGVVTGKIVLSGASLKGQDISGTYQFTDVFARLRGRWQVIASHSNRLGDESAKWNGEDLFVGRWKMNLSLSKVTGDTVRIEKTASGYQRTDGKISYGVPTNGQSERVSDLSSQVVSLAHSKPDYWEFTYSTDGRTDGVESWQLSPDGKSAVTHWRGKTPSGESFDYELIRKRSAASADLEGDWISVNASGDLNQEFEIVADGPGREKVSFPRQKLEYRARLDGTSFAISGPTIPPGFTQSVLWAAPLRRTIVNKVNGKTVEQWDCELSADGERLTQTGRLIDSDTPVVLVFERRTKQP